MINLCFDGMGEYNIGYPNLAVPGLGPGEFDNTWPKTIPLRLIVYLRRAEIEFRVHTVSQAPNGSWYPVALAWHDFDCDYFGLMSQEVHRRLKNREIRVLFYYHEGDHPGRIKDRLDLLCQQHGLPTDCYLFVSANSAARDLDNFYYFNDHEYFFSYINSHQKHVAADEQTRLASFTALNRVHKWWRASVMADLSEMGVLNTSLWSYNTACTIDDPESGNPLELDSVPGWRDRVYRFLDHGPYVCDHPNDTAHNDHRRINTDLYLHSYCHLVIETLFDVDGSGGVFLTEKTFKCLKFGQPFVIIGPAGSLDVLRESGYRVFDHAIDNSYDRISNNTQRWFAIKDAIRKIQSNDMHQWYLSCLDDVRHNQHVFTHMTHGLLEKLSDRLISGC